MKISIVILASGFSKRFGSNKLLYKIDNVTLIEKVFKSISMFHNEVVVVSTYEEIELLAKQYHYDYIKNNNPQNGISESVKLGTKHFINSDAILFMMGDQPFILKESIEKMFDEVNEKHILRASVKGKISTPTCIPKRYFNDLLEAMNDEGGRYVMRKYPEYVKLVEFKEEIEILDIDKLNDIRS